MQIPAKLYVSFITPLDEDRKNEVYSVLEHNSKSGIFKEIILLIDDNIRPPVSTQNTPINFMMMSRRPLFSDWLFHSINDEEPHYSVCANADIMFDQNSIQDIKKAISEKTFLALCRYEEEIGAPPSAHPNPQWTQDVWAMTSQDMKKFINNDHIKECMFPFGIPRCDGKISWVFFNRGWKVKNPCNEIVTVHRHRSGIRKYSVSNKTLLGGTCWVHPCDIADEESKITAQIVTLNQSEFSDLNYGRYLIDRQDEV